MFRFRQALTSIGLLHSRLRSAFANMSLIYSLAGYTATFTFLQKSCAAIVSFDFQNVPVVCHDEAWTMKTGF
jgi:hypothetical protein